MTHEPDRPDLKVEKYGVVTCVAIFITAGLRGTVTPGFISKLYVCLLVKQ
jgi:hypothetical protein